MKKLFLFVAAIAFLSVVTVSCGRASSETAETAVNVPNPVATYKSVTGITDVVGFDMIEMPESLGYKETAYEVIDKKIAQIQYEKDVKDTDDSGDEEEEAPASAAESRIVLRMAEGKDDISGIYGIDYDIESHHGMDVNVGMYNDIHIAWFVDSEYAYAITGYDTDGTTFEGILNAIISELLGLEEEQAG